MSVYRLYGVNADGHIGEAEWIEAIDDQAAIRQAHSLKLHAAKCEVWQESRHVATEAKAAE